METTIPAPLVVSGQGLPAVCARHGEPADRHRRVQFRSTPPSWTYGLILLGVVLFAIVATVLEKRVKAAAWPFCRQCAALRRRRMLAGVGLIVLAVVVVLVLATVLPPESSFGVPTIVVFVGLLLGGLFLLARSGWTAIVNGYTTRDGTAVAVRRPAERFVQEAEPARQWAIRQRAAQEDAARRWTDQYGR